jgi:hypothetical protein
MACQPVGDAAATILGELARIGGGSVTLTLNTSAPSQAHLETMARLAEGGPAVEAVGRTSQETGLFNGYPADEWLARQFYLASCETLPVAASPARWDELTQGQRLPKIAQARWLIEQGIVRVPQ